MIGLRQRVVRRVDMPSDVDGTSALDRADYRDAFLARGTDPMAADAVEWIRQTFESAPAPLRGFLRAGWSLFGARLARPGTPGHVLGWRIGLADPDRVRLEVRWAIGLRANLVLYRGADTLLLATFVRHDRAASRLLWPLLVPVHRLTLRALLTRVVRARR